jgi:hypothetical protein
MRRDLVASATAVLAAQYDGEYPQLEDPEGELLRVASESLALKDLLASKAAELDSVAHESKDGTQMVQASLQAYLSLLRDCSDLLVKINKLGLAERAVRVQESQIQQVSIALRAALADVRFSLDHDLQRQILAKTAENIAAA